MCKAMITTANPERLKIVSFLLQLAGWKVQSSEGLAEAVNYMKNADDNNESFDLLVVVDYSNLGQSSEDRLFEAQCLEICATLEQPLSVLVCGNDISLVEKECLAELIRKPVSYCYDDKLISRIESLHDQLCSRYLHMTL